MVSISDSEPFPDEEEDRTALGGDLKVSVDEFTFNWRRWGIFFFNLILF